MGVQLAAETAANLRRHDPDVALWYSEQVGSLSAHHESALRGSVDGQTAVGIVDCDRVVGFYVARMDRRGLEFAFDDQVGGVETGGEVAARELDVLRDVARAI